MPESEQERYIRFEKKFNAQMHDRVIILCTAQGHESGWRNIWVPEMDSAIGRTGTVIDTIPDGRGILLKIPGLRFTYMFPYFVLSIPR
jgi:hypothetical protein